MLPKSCEKFFTLEEEYKTLKKQLNVLKEKSAELNKNIKQISGGAATERKRITPEFIAPLNQIVKDAEKIQKGKATKTEIVNLTKDIEKEAEILSEEEEEEDYSEEEESDYSSSSSEEEEENNEEVMSEVRNLAYAMGRKAPLSQIMKASSLKSNLKENKPTVQQQRTLTNAEARALFQLPSKKETNTLTNAEAKALFQLPSKNETKSIVVQEEKKRGNDNFKKYREKQKREEEEAQRYIQEMRQMRQQEHENKLRSYDLFIKENKENSEKRKNVAEKRKSIREERDKVEHEINELIHKSNDVAKKLAEAKIKCEDQGNNIGVLRRQMNASKLTDKEKFEKIKSDYENFKKIVDKLEEENATDEVINPLIEKLNKLSYKVYLASVRYDIPLE